jgi:predicted nucleic acid-binding Zn ribbon protein
MLTSLTQVITHIQSQENWQQQRRFLKILEYWSNVVGDSVAQQTRPTGVYREILQVAVSSPVWSQALMFERFRILAKLNPMLVGMGETIQDIRFSTAKWLTTPPKLLTKQAESQHPSAMHTASNNTSANHEVKKPQDALEAFNRWSKLLAENTASLPKCTLCKCPTPPGELARWRMCRACAAVNLFN